MPPRLQCCQQALNYTQASFEPSEAPACTELDRPPGQELSRLTHRLTKTMTKNKTASSRSNPRRHIAYISHTFCLPSLPASGDCKSSACCEAPHTQNIRSPPTHSLSHAYCHTPLRFQPTGLKDNLSSLTARLKSESGAEYSFYDCSMSLWNTFLRGLEGAVLIA